MRQCLRDGVITPLTAEDAVRVFWDKLNISFIKKAPQEHHRLRLILNLLENPDEGTPNVNGTTDKEVSLELIKFGHTFPYILKEIWELYPSKGPVWVSKLDTADPHYRGMLRLPKVGAFA